jgi:hypothetical protein
MVIERCIVGDDNYMKKNAELIFYNFIYILLHLISFFQVLAWEQSYQLMRYSYQKGLSEEWYSQKLFWVFSLMIYLLCGTYEFILYDFYNIYRLTTDSIRIVLMIILIIMMLKTRKRTISEPRKCEELDLSALGGNWDTRLIDVA